MKHIEYSYDEVIRVFHEVRYALQNVAAHYEFLYSDLMERCLPKTRVNWGDKGSEPLLSADLLAKYPEFHDPEAIAAVIKQMPPKQQEKMAAFIKAFNSEMKPKKR